MKNVIRRILFSFTVFVAVAGLQGCTTSVPAPLPTLTFEHMGTFPVDVASVEIENRYDRGSDPQDVSAALPASLDKALDDYARARLRPAGQGGVLRFIVENASVHHQVVEPSDKLLDWTGMARKDFYEVEVKIGMEVSSADGWKGGSRSSVNIRRNIAIPQSGTVAQKDREKFDFLENLMADVDQAVTSALKDQIVPQP